jgi:hypothetical protein
VLIEGPTVIRVVFVNFHRHVITALMLCLPTVFDQITVHSRSGITARGGLCYQSLSVLQYKELLVSFLVMHRLVYEMSDFRLSLWCTAHVSSTHGYLHAVNMGVAADVLKIHFASIFRVKCVECLSLYFKTNIYWGGGGL